MAAFRFDPAKSFKENLAAFLALMEEEDAELGAVLRAHHGVLLDAIDDVKRRNARSTFNSAVKADLDKKLESGEGKK